MVDLKPVICTATVTNGAKLVTVTGTDASTGAAPVLNDLNCRPNAVLFLGGVGYVVEERLSTTTFNLERIYEGADAAGITCTIGIFTPEMANRSELSQQLRDYSARLALLREDWAGLVYTLGEPGAAADPGSGVCHFDEGTPASITGLYLDVLDARGRTVTGQIMTWRSATQVRVQSLETGAFVTVQLSGTPTNEGPDEWVQNPGVSLLASSGTLAPGELVAVSYMIAGTGLAADDQVDDLAGRAGFDDEAAGFTVRVNDVGDGRAALFTKNSATSADWSAAAYVTGPQGAQGEKGWSPRHALVSDGARRVLGLVDYVGGAGDEPTDNVGEYLGPAGYTAVIGDAIDIRGAVGPAGISGGGFKGLQCRVVITSNVDIAGGGIAAGTTHDGVTLDENDNALLMGQTDPAENGAYPSPAAGAASRHPDFATFDDHPGAYFSVPEGTTYADTLWSCTSNKGGTLGTTALTFARFAASTEDLKWLSKAIGELYAVDSSMAGADVPPTTSPSYRYALLTAGEDGVGEYNEGILTSESVSGSAPLVVATAAISLSGSPINGETINLINTEKRFLRASISPGTVENAAFASHEHSVSMPQLVYGGSAVNPGEHINGGPSNPPPVFATDGGSGYTAMDPRTAAATGDTETRSKNLQLTYYMRIK